MMRPKTTMGGAKLHKILLLLFLPMPLLWLSQQQYSRLLWMETERSMSMSMSMMDNLQVHPTNNKTGGLDIETAVIAQGIVRKRAETTIPPPQSIQESSSNNSNNNNNNNKHVTITTSSNISNSSSLVPPRIAYIAYGHFKPGGEDRFRRLIVGSLDTWLFNDDDDDTTNNTHQSIYYVLNKSYQPQYEAFCHSNTTLLEVYCPRIVPIYVDHCPEGYYGEAPSCKMDAGLTYMWDHHSQDYDWFSYQDDDMYVRTDYLQAFLTGLNASDPVLVDASRLNKQLGITFKADNMTNCSDSNDWRYPWAQPAIYSFGALARLSNGFRLGAVQKQSREFFVTHDAANSVVHLMYSLPWVLAPPVPVAPMPGPSLRAFAIHGVGRNHKDMYAIHTIFMDIKHNPNKNKNSGNDTHWIPYYPKPPYDYKWNRPTGFRQTETYRKYGDPSTWTTEWHTMPVAECRADHHATTTTTTAMAMSKALQ